MQLWNQRVETDYETIGKTYLGNDIWRFKAGNPNDGHVLLDSERNGIEDKGSEILYLMAKWLLKSGDSSAEDTLTKIMCYLYRY